MDQAKGFLESLFDFSFTTFVTSKLIKILYVLSIVCAALGSLFLIVIGFTLSTALGVLMLLIASPLLFLSSVIYARVLLEIMIVIFRISEHTAEIAAQGRAPIKESGA